MDPKAHAFQVQNQIKQNSTELSDYFQELGKWEKTIRKRDKQLSKKRGSQSRHVVPIRNTGGTVKIAEHLSTERKLAPRRFGILKEKAKKGSAASHTYDKGYKKWEKFDVDAELEAIETNEETEIKHYDVDKSSEYNSHEVLVTPASITADAPKPSRQVSVPKARGSNLQDDPEEAMRKIGNEHFKKGEFPEAVKAYTRCLGINSRSFLARSNRAMAYLKLKEFQRAEDDCSISLSIDPTHVKSMQRRAVAKNALGKHRSALLDLEAALKASPACREITTEVRKTHELYRSAVRRAPKTSISVSVEQMPSGPQPESSSKLEKKQTLATQFSSTADKKNSEEQFSKLGGENQVILKNDDSSKLDSINSFPIPKKCSYVGNKSSSATPPLPPPPRNKTKISIETTEHVQNGETKDEMPNTQKRNEEEPIITPSTMLKYFKETAEHKSPGPDFTKKTVISEDKALRVPQSSKKKAGIKKGNARNKVFKVPKTSYEVERVWGSLKGDAEMKKRYISLIKPQALPKIFKNGIEADLLCGMLDTVDKLYLQRTVAHENIEIAMKWLQGLAATPRFNMIILLLSDAEKIMIQEFFTSIGNILEEVNQDSKTSTELDILKDVYKIPS